VVLFNLTFNFVALDSLLRVNHGAKLESQGLVLLIFSSYFYFLLGKSFWKLLGKHTLLPLSVGIRFYHHVRDQVLVEQLHGKLDDIDRHDELVEVEVALDPLGGAGILIQLVLKSQEFVFKVNFDVSDQVLVDVVVPVLVVPLLSCLPLPFLLPLLDRVGL